MVKEGKSKAGLFPHGYFERKGKERRENVRKKVDEVNE